MKKGVKRHHWTPDEISYLIAHYPDETAGEVAGTLGVGNGVVYRKAYELELKKSEKFKQSEKSRIIRQQTEQMKESWFKKGQKPWNDGKKGYMGANRGSFQKGHLPVQTRHDGAISIRKDKAGKAYQYIRVEKAVWERLSVKIWTDAHGKLQPGMVVIFKDGNTMNCVLENLESITTAENMRRNSITRYPAELRSVLYQLSKLKKQINHVEDNNE